jgi:hypothetical protein
MRNCRFISAPIYILVALAMTLMISCGGEGRDIPPRNTGVGQVVRQVRGVSGMTPVLRCISVTPSNPLDINSGTQLQYTAAGSYTDNSTQDLTTIVVWSSSDTSVATVSNAPDSKGLALAVSKGYCSISATLGNVSGSTVIGVN